MALDNVISGKEAFVEGFACITSWTATSEITEVPIHASCVPDGTEIPAGNISWSGTITGLGANAPIPNGINIPFKGVIDARAGKIATLEGTVLIEEVTLNFPRAEGGKATWSATWSAQGAMVETANAITPDATVGGSDNAKDFRVFIWDGVSAYAELENVQSGSFIMVRPSTSFVFNGLMYRRVGNLEARLSVDVFDKIENALAQPNDLAAVRLWVNATPLFWQINDIRFTGRSDFTVNRETNEIVGYTLNGAWSAITAGGTLGAITKPNGAAVYPVP